MLPRRLAFLAGVVIGLVLPMTVLGVGATHSVCSSGSLLGWSGLVATPDEVTLAPPGGFVNDSWVQHVVVSSTFSFSTGGYSAYPINFSRADFGVTNWTLSSVVTSRAPGWGPDARCPADALGTGSLKGLGSGGCTGCEITPPTAGGVGNRLLLPSQFYYGTVPSVILNTSYSSIPAASFSWMETGGGVEWSSSASLQNLTTGIGPFYLNGSLLGLGVTAHFSTIRFGIPIHLLSGGTETYPGSYPLDYSGSWESVSLSITQTYVFPAATEQGDWSVYVAGAGSAFSPGGLLFVQTAAL